MRDITEEVYGRGNYISIIVPYYCRPHYMEALINSIEKFADMPYELIVHDDGSPDGSPGEIWEKYKDRVSTIIFNRGRNLGLSVASNRLVSMADSNYILFMNADCEVIRPCFRDIVNTLSRKYVGFLHPHDFIGAREYAEVNGTKFTLSRFIGGASMMAFRKDVWEEVGGFNTDGFTGCADASFLLKVLNAGYFRACLLGDPKTRNISFEEQGNKDASGSFHEGYDNNYPKLFGVDHDLLDRYSKIRLELCCERVHEEENKDAGWANMNYWVKDEEQIMPVETEISSINWEAAKKHNKIRWKDLVDAEKWERT